MERERSKAIESLEITDGYVKCQSCGTLKPIIKDDSKLTSSDESKKIHRLRMQIKRIEKYNFGGGISAAAVKEKAELAALLEQQKKNDIFRRIPLYPSEEFHSIESFLFCLFATLDNI